MSLFDGFNKEYAKQFQDEHLARATVGGAELKTGALIEIAVVAHKQ